MKAASLTEWLKSHELERFIKVFYKLAPETLQTVDPIMESVAMAKKKLDRDEAEIRALDDGWNRNAPEKRSE